MAYVYALDPAVPANSDKVSLGAGNIRDFKSALIERIQSFFTSVDGQPWTVKTGATFVGTATFGGLVTAQSLATTAGATIGNGLSVTAGTAALQATTTTTLTSTGLATFSAGATVASGQNLTLTGVTIVGQPTWSSSQNLNAATATKLQTARTIWGQSFDGTANVTGTLTGADATFSSTVAVSGKLSVGVTADVNQMVLRGNPTQGMQIIIGDLAGASWASMGARYSSAGAFMATNAQQPTNSTNMWHQNAAAARSAIVDLDAANGFSVRYAPIGSADATFASFWTVTALSVSNTGSVQAAGAFSSAGNAGATANSMYKSATDGMILQAGAGSANDFTIYTSNASAVIMNVPTGTRNIVIPNGSLSVPAGLTVSTGTSAFQQITATIGTYSVQLRTLFSGANILVCDTRSSVGAGGTLALQAQNSSSTMQSYATISASITDATAGAEQGDLIFNTRRVGIVTEAARFKSDGTAVLQLATVNTITVATALNVNNNIPLSSKDSGGTLRKMVLWNNTNSVTFGDVDNATNASVTLAAGGTGTAAISAGGTQIATFTTILATFNKRISVAPAVAAGSYTLSVQGAAGAARDVASFGLSGYSAGLTIQYDGTKMVYTFGDSTATTTFVGSIAVTTGTSALQGVTATTVALTNTLSVASSSSVSSIAGKQLFSNVAVNTGAGAVPLVDLSTVMAGEAAMLLTGGDNSGGYFIAIINHDSFGGFAFNTLSIPANYTLTILGTTLYLTQTTGVNILASGRGTTFSWT